MPARFDYQTCEPFRAWNRVEPRVRKEEFSRVLRSEIHDPLWMLTRQWQFGEFKGEDTGSAIFARTLLKTSRLKRFQGREQSAQDYDDDMPLETLVEREAEEPDFRTRLLAGQRWLQILDELGVQFNATVAGRNEEFSLSAYRTKLANLFEFTLPEPPASSSEANNHLEDIQVSKLLTNQHLKPFIAAVKGRTIDGIALYDSIKANSAVARGWKIHTSHEDLLENVADLFKRWIQRKLTPSTSQSSPWNPSRLEYQFACAAPSFGKGDTAFVADEYYHGRLDWYAFDVHPNPSGILTTSPQRRTEALHQEVITFIPTPAAFSGMPNSRWWEFEDGSVDLGNISADTTELAKVVLSEFALIYGNDWFVLPYSIAVGSLCEVGGIVVTDVFGQQTLVESASQGKSDDWESWGLFNLSPRQLGTPLADNVTDTRLFLPPAVSKVQESEPIEQVLFIRDEIANLVWAIETKVPDLLTRSLDGHGAATELTKFWLELQGIDPDADPEIHEKAIYKYMLGNTVPENWIPFVAVHKKDGQNRAVRLQRASMPRLYFGDFKGIRPRTQILSYGLRNDPGQQVQPFVNPSQEEQDFPYYINEEEVPRAGIKLTATFQRTRWYDGRIFCWYGRRKTMGRGQGGSGLAFDILQLARKNKKEVEP